MSAKEESPLSFLAALKGTLWDCNGRIWHGMIERRLVSLLDRLHVANLRASCMKIKINGVCVNNCAYCLFHNDPRRLEVKDIAYFLEMLDNPRFGSLEINGGEPTIHPRFLEICAFLRERFKGRVTLTLGTNLIPMSWERGWYPKIYRRVLETFDHIAVGCDDEHKNIHILERMAPDIVSAGLKLYVTVVKAYCSDETRQRILSLKANWDITVFFSEVLHFHESRSAVNDVSTPCRRRLRQFLLNCNGDGFFCWRQEMETPLFNLFNVGREELNYYMNDYDPERYQFCSFCPDYKPDTAVHKVLRSRASPIRMF